MKLKKVIVACSLVCIIFLIVSGFAAYKFLKSWKYKLNACYAKDSQHIYYSSSPGLGGYPNYEQLTDADYQSFSALGDYSHVGKDKNNVYFVACNGTSEGPSKISEADPATFKLFDTSKDNQSSNSVLDKERFSKDKNKVWYLTKEVLGLDAKSTNLYMCELDKNAAYQESYFADKNGVYKISHVGGDITYTRVASTTSDLEKRNCKAVN